MRGGVPLFSAGRGLLRPPSGAVDASTSPADTAAVAELRFYYDIVCPYAYLASMQVEALAARVGAELQWRPVLLGGLFRAAGAPQLPAAAMSPPRARYNLLDLQRWADRWGVPLTFPAAHPRRTVEAMRLLTAVDHQPKRVELSRALFRAYWADGLDVSDRAVLAELARRVGVDPDLMDSQTARDGLFASTAEAAQLGAFGVPALAVGDRLWWGQDRLHFVEAALGGQPPRPGDRPIDPPAEPAEIDLFFDFSSPFAYLAATQIERIAAAHRARVCWRPILLGALFRELGTPDVPLFTMSQAKQRYMLRDLNDWAALWRVPFRFPSHFPIRTVVPLRLALLDPALILPLFHACWAEDRAIDDPAVLAELLRAAGHDPEDMLRRAEDPAIKAALRHNTEAAREAGCCGVPSMVVRRPHSPPVLLWGQDRLGMLEDVLAGWQPPRG